LTLSDLIQPMQLTAIQGLRGHLVPGIRLTGRIQ